MGIWASNASPLLYCIPFIVSATLIVAASRRKAKIAVPAADGRRVGRLVGIASACEGLAILAAFAFLPNMQAADFAVSVITIIVGVHFIPLARWLPARPYYSSAALLVALGVTGLTISDPDLRIRYVCIGAAFALWISYGVTMRTGHKHDSPPTVRQCVPSTSE